MLHAIISEVSHAEGIRRGETRELLARATAGIIDLPSRAIAFSSKGRVWRDFRTVRGQNGGRFAHDAFQIRKISPLCPFQPSSIIWAVTLSTLSAASYSMLGQYKLSTWGDKNLSSTTSASSVVSTSSVIKGRWHSLSNPCRCASHH